MITKVDRKYLEINSPEEIKSSEPKVNCKIEFKNAKYVEDQIQASVTIKKISKNEE